MIPIPTKQVTGLRFLFSVFCIGILLLRLGFFTISVEFYKPHPVGSYDLSGLSRDQARDRQDLGLKFVEIAR